jgi:hypothetical protein
MISKRDVLAGWAVACTAGAAFADGVEHTLRSDNGVYELSYTVLNNEAMIGNYYFVPGDEPLTIDSVEVALGFGQGGLPLELSICNDPDNDGNPTNAELLSTTPGIVAPDGTDPRVLRLQTVEVDPFEVTGGFFVAVRLKDQPFSPPNYSGNWETAPSAYRLNYSGPTNNWRVVGLPSNGPMGGVNPIDVVDLSTNFVSNVQFNWVIRVTGTVAEPPILLQGDMNGDGRHDLFDSAMFLDMFQSNEADFNGDGVTDFFDLAAFMVAWQQNPA